MSSLKINSVFDFQTPFLSGTSRSPHTLLKWNLCNSYDLSLKTSLAGLDRRHIELKEKNLNLNFGPKLLTVSASVTKSPIQLFRKTLKDISSTLYSPINGLMLEKMKILEPIEGSGLLTPETDSLLVFLPGAFTPPDAYLPLVEAIQKEAIGLRLWVVILNFTGEVATKFEIEERYKGARERLRSMGYKDGPMQSSNVIFAGHSWGAYEGRSPALILAQGFIQMGSTFLLGQDNLAQYPKPVLTIAGEYDGHSGLLTFAKSADEVESVRTKLGDSYLLENKPVIVIRGMNHAQFSHGVPNTKRGDVPAVIPIEEAREKASRLVAAFLEVHFLGTEEVEKKSKVEEMLEVLKLGVDESNKLLRPFWEAMNRQKEGWENLQERLVERAGLASDVGPFKTEIIWYDFQDDFVYSKPWIDVKEKKIVCHAKLVEQGKFKTSSNVWIKMKSAEAVRVALGTKDLDEEMDVASGEHGGIGHGSVTKKAEDVVVTRAAADVNKTIFAQALGECDEAVRRRYEGFGKKIQFLDDRVTTDGADWVESDLTFIPSKEDSNIVGVQSPVILTPAQGILPRFAGMHYMKVWTVARAMDWIVLESFSLSEK